MFEYYFSRPISISELHIFCIEQHDKRLFKFTNYYYFFEPTSTKPQAEILTLNKVNGCNVSFGDHSVLEGDRIPPLKSRGQALKEEL